MHALKSITMEPDLIATGKRRRRRLTLRERIGKLKRAKGRIHYQLFYYGYQAGSSMKTLGKLQDKRNDQTRVQIGKLEAVGNESASPDASPQPFQRHPA